MNPMFETLKRSDLPLRNCGILRRHSSTRPTLWLVEERGKRAVVKDFSLNGLLYRHTAGRFLVWREQKAYRRLQGLSGVPALYRTLDGLSVIIEEIPGRNVEKLEKEVRLPEAFFTDLKDLVNRVHERGIAHCDLKRAPNILLGRDGRPYIVDWGASISHREFAWYPLNLIYRRFLLDDHMAVTKLKLRHRPASVTPEEKRRYEHRSGLEHLVRALRNRLRKTLQKIA
jgi:tRNA A-37 threonylcarbamoyl transferase component Bud32